MMILDKDNNKELRGKIGPFSGVSVSSVHFGS